MLRINKSHLLIYLFMIQFFLPEKAYSDIRCDENVTVIAYSDMPGYCGVFRTWVKVTGKLNNKMNREYYVLYLKKYDFPKIGSVCNICYTIENVNGLVGRMNSVNEEEGRSVRTIKCKSGADFDFTN